MGKKISLVPLLWILVVASVLAAQIVNFNTQSNPFNITFNNRENQTFYFNIPLYAYLNNLTLTFNSFYNEVNTTISKNKIINGTYNRTWINRTYTKVFPVTNFSHQVIFGYSGGSSVYIWNQSLIENISYTLKGIIYMSDITSGDVPRPKVVVGVRNYTNCTEFEAFGANWFDCKGNLMGYAIGINYGVEDGLTHAYELNMNVTHNGTGLQIINNSNGVILGNTMTKAKFFSILVGSNAVLTVCPDMRYWGTIYNFSGTTNGTILNPSVDTSKNDNIIDWNSTKITNPTQANLNVSPINYILKDGCTCYGCLLSSNICTVPLTFGTDDIGIWEVNATDIEYYTNLTVNIYDRETDALITNLVTLNIGGFDNFTTTTGQVIVTNLTPIIDQWTLIASSTGYTTEIRTLDLTNHDSTFVDIYLINATSTATGKLIVQVYDDFYNLIQGANTKLLEFDIGSNSFVEVSQCFTNSDGECIFDVELDTKFYIITTSKVISGILYTAQSTETGEVFKIDNTIVELHLRTSGLYEAPEYYDLRINPYNTSLVGNVSYLTATFDDGSNINHTVCIGYYVRIRQNENLIAETCINGSSGIINYAGGYNLTRSYTYVAKIYIKNPTDVFYEYVYGAISGTWRSEWGIYLKPFLFFLLLSILATALYLREMMIWIVGSIVHSIVTLSVYPGLIGGVTVSIIIVINLCIFKMAKQRMEGIA